jgi:hypothetical protein
MKKLFLLIILISNLIPQETLGATPESISNALNQKNQSALKRNFIIAMERTFPKGKEHLLIISFNFDKKEFVKIILNPLSNLIREAFEGRNIQISSSLHTVIIENCEKFLLESKEIEDFLLAKKFLTMHCNPFTRDFTYREVEEEGEESLPEEVKEEVD